ncbi:MAG: hypothetical protein ABIQ88_12960 [Chitinophagaceae bacterium]
MKKSIAVFTLLLIMLYAVPAPAQSKTITINGKITSFEESFALEGVSIQVKGGAKNTGTQADGTFSLELLPEEKYWS